MEVCDRYGIMSKWTWTRMDDMKDCNILYGYVSKQMINHYLYVNAKALFNWNNFDITCVDYKHINIQFMKHQFRRSETMISECYEMWI